MREFVLSYCCVQDIGCESCKYKENCEKKSMHGGDIYRNKVKMDFSVNINPLGMPESVKAALMEAVADCSCYPDIRQEELKQAIHVMSGADKNNILCGNGASELFMAIVHGLKPKKIVIPVPSFFGYEKAAKASGAEVLYYEMKLEENFCLTDSVTDFLSEDTDILFLANPNNPVGNRLSTELLEKILRHCMAKNIVVVLDECFIEFTEGWEQYSFLRRVGEFPNLIVVRGFTKIFAIPGVRLGYLVCDNLELIKKIEEQLPEWNLSVFAQKAGIAAAKETAYRMKSAEAVKTEREYLTGELQKLGVLVYPSEANYLMVYTEYPLAEELLKRGILIRDCSNYRGLTEGYYRIAIKQREENEKLLAEIGELICR